MSGIVIEVDKTSPRCDECRLILPHHRGYPLGDSPACSQWTPEGEIESRRILEEQTKDWASL